MEQSLFILRPYQNKAVLTANRDFKIPRGDRNENVKKKGLISTTTLHVPHFFVHFFAVFEQPRRENA